MTDPRTFTIVTERVASGRGTFEQVVAGISRLIQAEKQFHIISVLTEANIFIPDEMFFFYDALGVSSICFNVEESDGIHASNLLPMKGIRHAYSEFLKAFAFLAEIYKRNWFIRELDQMKRAIFRPADAPFRNPQVEPFGIVCVDIQGNFTTFSPEFISLRDPRFGDFRIGNLISSPIEAALSNPKFTQLRTEIAAGVELCRAIIAAITS